MSFTDHRQKILDSIEEQSLVIVYAGHETHQNEDDYARFVVNSQFYWMTGLERPGMILLMYKLRGVCHTTLYIDAFDPMTVRWTGKMPTKEEVAEVSGIQDVRYTSAFTNDTNRLLSKNDIQHVYFDLYRLTAEDLRGWNEEKAAEFARKYPAIRMHDLHALAARFRTVKDQDEIDMIRKAIGITKKGLEFVMEELRPGKYEYQVAADFEYRCRYEGSKNLAFNTIAGSGINGCMMHYVDKDRRMEENDLILLDLGASYKNYCSDITRVYPANGKFTPRQKELYNLVLKANKAIAEAARPGVTLKELSNVANQVLGQELVKMGMIEDVSQVGKYLMHGVSHCMGIDVHDINMDPDALLQPGWVITNEPGLYVDEEAIGIRIEDDLLITEDGCIVLSQDIIKEADEIEAYMAEHNRNLQGQ